MTRQDAVELAQLIAKTWRGGPHADIWAEELETLHAGQARATYEALRRTEEHAPTIARFLQHYQTLTRDDDVRIVCEKCDGGGWVEAPERARHSPDCRRRRARDADPRGDPLDAVPSDDCHCSAVVPCTCIAGQRNHAAYIRLTGASAA